MTRLPQRARGAALLLAAGLAMSSVAGVETTAADARRLRLDHPVPTEVAYAAVAEAWGRQVALDPGLTSRTVRVDFEETTFEAALGLLAAVSGHHAVHLADGSALVVNSTPGEVSRHHPPVHHRFELARADAGEVATALRTLVGVGGEIQATGNGVEMRLRDIDVEHAALVVGWLDDESPQRDIRWPRTANGIPLEPQDLRPADWRPQRLRFPEETPRDRIHERIESLWDVDIVLDPRLTVNGSTTLELEAANLFQALDVLTRSAARSWALHGARRILISAEDGDSSRLRPVGYARFPLRWVEPRTARRTLDRLGFRIAAVGSLPAMLLVKGSVLHLAAASFVVEKLEVAARERVAPGILWLGPGHGQRAAGLRRYLDLRVSSREHWALGRARPDTTVPPVRNRYHAVMALAHVPQTTDEWLASFRLGKTVRVLRWERPVLFALGPTYRLESVARALRR